MSERSDDEQYAQWTAGDRRAGGELIDRHLGAVTRFFANKTTSRLDVEDLVATTFERVSQSLGQFRAQGSFRSYVLRVALNVLRDGLRRQRPLDLAQVEEVSLRDFGPSPSTFVHMRAQHRLLGRALRALPLRFQIVLELRFFERLTREEMADVLDLPPGTVASRLRQARTRLGQALERLTVSDDVLRRTTLGDIDRWVRDIRDQLGRPNAARATS